MMRPIKGKVDNKKAKAAATTAMKKGKKEAYKEIKSDRGKFKLRSNYQND